MDIIDVPLDDLIMDMPVDEENVKRKMESLTATGLGQPIFIWLHDLRIIDGFHRVEAARRLGWQTIACVVRDCDEEAFWSWRIQSARSHHSITRDRLLTWIKECWVNTPWFATFRLDEDTEQELASAARALWEIQSQTLVAKDLSPFWSKPLNPVRQPIRADLQPMFGWFMQRGNEWGMTLEDLISIICGLFGVRCRPELDKVAVSHQMSLPERIKLESEIPIFADRHGQEELTEYLDHHRPGESYIAYTARLEFEQKERERKAAAEQARKQKAEYAAWLATETQDDRSERLRRQMILVIDDLNEKVHEQIETLRAMHDGPNLLIGLAEWAVKTCNELWPHLNIQMPRRVPKLSALPSDVVVLSESELK